MEKEGIIDSEVVAMLLSISTTNLRQLVHRKQLIPVGKRKRKNLFNLQDVLALQAKREGQQTN